MKHPYIGKGLNSGSIVLFYEQNKGVTLESKTWESENLQHSNCINEDLFKNITREYLANTYGEVKSEEHAEFIVKLAEVAGFEVGVYCQVDKWFCFSENLLFFYPTESRASDAEEKLITIPLPPKESKLPEANSGTPMPEVKEPKGVSMNDIQVNVKNNTDSLVQIKKSDDESSIFIYVNDPPKEPEHKEWPQVGDEVLHNGLKYITKGVDGFMVWVESKWTGQYSTFNVTQLKKPPTPEEELAKELEKMVYDGMDNSYDLNHNCYYLVSGLMKKYDIKKKPE